MADRDDFGATLTFDLSRPGRIGCVLPPLDVPEAPLPSSGLLRDDITLPELSQPDVVRYFTQLSQRNFSIDTGFYPLGSCSMKYNPRVNEVAARLPGLANVHPMQAQGTTQGALALMHGLQRLLAEITGLHEVSLAPDAGAHGELAGILIASAYHNSNGGPRCRVLVPDSAHGTNPATAAMAGFEVESIPSDAEENLDFEALRVALDANGNSVAALMLTLPSTLGLFEPRIMQIADLLHDHGALLYGDGANMNAMLGRVKPGDLGFDVFHLNLHKTFSTPHGGGGPGAGPIAVTAALAPFLPSPHVRRDKGSGAFSLETPERSIGRLGLFHGNFGVLVRAYAYILSLGAEGLRGISEAAVLNANYILTRLRSAYRLAYDRRCMHEAVFSADWQKARGAGGLEIAKRLLDYGFHAPTMYFPLIVHEALMIEPTESETKETLDAFIQALRDIDREITENPDLVRQAPHTPPVSRLDEAKAARQPDLRWKREPN